MQAKIISKLIHPFSRSNIRRESNGSDRTVDSIKSLVYSVFEKPFKWIFMDNEESNQPPPPPQQQQQQQTQSCSTTNNNNNSSNNSDNNNNSNNNCSSLKNKSKRKFGDILNEYESELRESNSPSSLQNSPSSSPSSSSSSSSPKSPVATINKRYSPYRLAKIAKSYKKDNAPVPDPDRKKSSKGRINIKWESDDKLEKIREFGKEDIASSSTTNSSSPLVIPSTPLGAASSTPNPFLRYSTASNIFGQFGLSQITIQGGIVGRFGLKNQTLNCGGTSFSLGNIDSNKKRKL